MFCWFKTIEFTANSLKWTISVLVRIQQKNKKQTFASTSDRWDIEINVAEQPAVIS